MLRDGRGETFPVCTGEVRSGGGRDEDWVSRELEYDGKVIGCYVRAGVDVVMEGEGLSVGKDKIWATFIVTGMISHEVRP